MRHFVVCVLVTFAAAGCQIPRTADLPMVPAVEATAAVDGGVLMPPRQQRPGNSRFSLEQRIPDRAALRGDLGALCEPTRPPADARGQACLQNGATLTASTEREQIVAGRESAMTRTPPVQQASFSQPVELELSPLDADQAGAASALAPDVPEPIPAVEWALDELQQIALSWNPTLVQASAAIRAAEGRYVQEGLYPNPTIGYAGGDIGLENTSGQQGMVFGQEVVTHHKLRLARAVAGYDIEKACYDLDAQRQRVMNDVRTAYYEVLIAQETVEVAKRLVDISEEFVEVNERLREQLEVSRPVVLQSRIEANAAKLSLTEAESAYEAAWRRLAAVIGQPEIERRPLNGNLHEGITELTWEEALQQLLTQSPQLDHAYAGVAQARTEVARQCAERWPNFEIGSWVKYDETALDTLLDVEVAVPLPVFNRNQGAIIDAEGALIIAEREVQRVELSLTNQLASVFERYDIAKRQMQIYRDSIVPDAQEALNLARVGYREGEFGYLDLLLAQVTYFDASLELLARLEELWASSIELEGLLLSGSLDGSE
jgi:cobalt-zinc-cadmium efflux system outer membrane protein